MKAHSRFIIKATNARTAWAFVSAGFAAGAIIYYSASLFLEKKGAAVRYVTQFREYARARKQADASERIKQLATCDLMRHLPADQIERILPCIRDRQLKADEILFRAGDPGDALYIVAHGKVEVLANGQPGADAFGNAIAVLGAGRDILTEPESKVVLGAYGDGLRRSVLAVAAIVLYGLAVLGMAVTPSYAGGVAAMLCIGVAYVAVASVLMTSIQLAVDDGFRGRVIALYAMVFTGAYPLGSLLQGIATDHFGVRAVVAVAGGALLVYAALLAAHPERAASLDFDVADADAALQCPQGIGQPLG